ncbi:MAG: hypothetical protein QOJ64_3498 [Acidobacteriota bacterium]|jgi:hypothetical protein|nr:hypothetical protein [Acidobacteriota bacterium]
MKSQFFRASSTLVLVLLLALGLSGVAQERRQPPTQQEESPVRELAVQQIDTEALRIALPPGCKGAPDVQIHDVADNFSSPGNPVSLSPALATYLSGKPLKGYDDSRTDTVFADSFKLRSCKVCYATLELGVRHGPGNYVPNAPNFSNDKIFAGAGPFSLSQIFMGSANIWSSTNPVSKPLTLVTTGTGLSNLNNYLFTTTNSPTLDVVAQDDTEFDYAKLTVWY